MKSFLVLYKKRPLFPIMLSLLLLFAVSLTVIGAAMLASAHRQSVGISNEYVTIAVPPDRRQYTWEERENGMAKDEPSIPLYLAHETAMKSGFVEDVDYRYILGAEVMGSKAISSGYRNVMDYNAYFDNPCYNMAIFAVKCVKSEMPSTDKDATLIDPGSTAYYLVETEIIDVISLADGYPDIYDNTALVNAHEHGVEAHQVKATVPAPATMRIYGTLFTPNGEIPFQQGRTYLIYGFYHDYPVDTIKTPTSVITGRILDSGRYFHLLDETRKFLHLTGTVVTSPDFERIYDDALQVKRDYMDDGTPYYYPNEEMLPRWAEYSGSWEEFLAGNEGQVWREEIIPLCHVNQSSATVILSDNVQSMYVFNTGIAGLIEGRFFDATDYAEGSNVCMVSAAYAQYNNYQLGDKLTLDLYDTGFYACDAIPRGPCLPEDRMNVTGEYEIVGIYSAPEFSLGEQLICADTILVPKKSVPGNESFGSIPVNRLMTSLILKNGTKEQLLAYMDRAGQKDAYLCFDQSFRAAEISLDAVLQNGRQLLWTGVAALIVASALAHFLTMRRFAPSAKTMRILGIDRKVVTRQALGAFLTIDALAVILGAGLSAVLFSIITEKALARALAPDPLVIIGSAAAAFLLLASSSLLCAKLLSNIPLMQTGKNRRSQR
jgi:Predicted ABC-type transport system involved in lysophospholipase L1 biosynthesis, permease component